MNQFLKNLLINLAIASTLFTSASTMEKWAPDHVKEQIIEKKEKNREDFKNRVEVRQAKKDKMFTLWSNKNSLHGLINLISTDLCLRNLKCTLD